MHFRIAIKLAGRGLQDGGALLARELKDIVCADHAGSQGRDRITLIVSWRSWASKIIDPINRPFDLDRVYHIVFAEAEPGMIKQRLHIRQLPSEKIVDTVIVDPFPRMLSLTGLAQSGGSADDILFKQMVLTSDPGQFRRSTRPQPRPVILGDDVRPLRDSSLPNPWPAGRQCDTAAPAAWRRHSTLVAGRPRSS
jgi:hypothetical protein